MAPRRTAAAALCLAAAALAGCTGLAERYRAREPGWEPEPPAAGQPTGAVLAALADDAGPGRSVELRELRVVDRSEEPWSRVPAEAVVTGTDGASPRLGATAVRRCSHRDGLTAEESERASWYLFEEGRLVAFDHVVFRERCETELRYLPVDAERAADERALARYAAQRAESEGPSGPEPVLRRGLALVRAGRLEEAEDRLRVAERALRGVEAERDRLAEGSDERAAATDRLRHGRRLREKLEERLEAAREGSGGEALDAEGADAPQSASE